MDKIIYTDNKYQTAETSISFFNKLFPSLAYYPYLFMEVFSAAAFAKKNSYDDKKWIASSIHLMRRLEQSGLQIEISGIENLFPKKPVVIIGNHMSMMETIILPGIICPIKPITFVVKQSLLNYPIFKHVMRSRNPIAVTRTKPRADLKKVMEEGVKRLQNNISVIVFPQTTRAHTFSANEMSTIGVKLAKKAGVQAVPLALKTDGWDNGKTFKDFGRIRPERKVYFSFGKPMARKRTYEKITSRVYSTNTAPKINEAGNYTSSFSISYSSFSSPESSTSSSSRESSSSGADA